MNAVLGVVQESKAEKGAGCAEKDILPHVKVKRAGNVKQIQTGKLVPGDIVLVRQGISSRRICGCWKAQA